MSDVPPGGNGTTILMGFEGYASCAYAEKEVSNRTPQINECKIFIAHPLR
jgi:hypothetical protein